MTGKTGLCSASVLHRLGSSPDDVQVIAAPPVSGRVELVRRFADDIRIFQRSRQFAADRLFCQASLSQYRQMQFDGRQRRQFLVSTFTGELTCFLLIFNPLQSRSPSAAYVTCIPILFIEVIFYFQMQTSIWQVARKTIRPSKLPD